MKLGIFGGSFDPIHVGHLLVAETCREDCALDAIVFVPAHQPPHKRRQLCEPRHRIEMIKLAIAGNSAFELSEIEIDKGGTSYTYETLERLQQNRPGDELFFLMGADSLDDFSSWKHPDKICRLAVPVVVQRRGSPPVDLERMTRYVEEEDRKNLIRACQVDAPSFEVSSSEIRERLGGRRSIRYRVPRAVEKYIETNRLYGQGSDGC